MNDPRVPRASIRARARDLRGVNTRQEFFLSFENGDHAHCAALLRELICVIEVCEKVSDKFVCACVDLLEADIEKGVVLDALTACFRSSKGNVWCCAERLVGILQSLFAEYPGRVIRLVHVICDNDIACVLEQSDLLDMFCEYFDLSNGDRDALREDLLFFADWNDSIAVSMISEVMSSEFSELYGAVADSMAFISDFKQIATAVLPLLEYDEYYERVLVRLVDVDSPTVDLDTLCRNMEKNAYASIYYITQNIERLIGEITVIDEFARMIGGIAVNGSADERKEAYHLLLVLSFYRPVQMAPVMASLGIMDEIEEFVEGEDDDMTLSEYNCAIEALSSVGVNWR